MFKLNKVIVLLMVFASVNAFSVDLKDCEKRFPNVLKVLRKIINFENSIEQSKGDEDSPEKLMKLHLYQTSLLVALATAMEKDLSEKDKKEFGKKGEQALIMRMIDACYDVILENSNK